MMPLWSVEWKLPFMWTSFDCIRSAIDQAIVASLTACAFERFSAALYFIPGIFMAPKYSSTLLLGT